MKLLIIGGAGLVGRSILPHLPRTLKVTVLDRAPADDLDVTVIRGEATDPDVLEVAMRGMDAVLYLAAVVAWETMPLDYTKVRAGLDVNVSGLYIALRLATDLGISSFVHASSLSVFEHSGKRAVDVRTDEPDATSPYGLSKRLAEMACATVASTTDMTITSLRLVGPTTDEAWPLWQPPRSDRAPMQPTLDDGTDYVALAPLDLARAIGAAITRRGPYIRPVVTSDPHGLCVRSDHETIALGWAPQRKP